ncbi:MAG: RnfABCDGE type electron transport complex subunit B [Lentisphaerae bacterium]|nr:RnfABCDGE type electron transport complex subunit B [Lentisphaerota bacterium]
MTPILATSLTIGGAGLACSGLLALAARFLSVEEDPRVEEVTNILPGANCGGCGFAGCANYAEAIIVDNAAINLCAPGGADVLKSLADMLGQTAQAAEHKVAIVLCNGDTANAPRKFEYNGVADCHAAHAIGGGDKLCSYGCLGYASCARVCPVGAIEMTGGIAKVHPDLCISCTACVKACPRQLIKMVPSARTIHVLCSSKDKGPAVKKACKVGCIGCTLCTKQVDDEQIKMEGFLAVVDYAKPLDSDAPIEKCPTHCIVRT